MFIGELYRRSLLQESIIKSVFEMLLGISTNEDKFNVIYSNIFN